MRKLIKLTALFTLLLLFYGTTFGGGWQKLLIDAPIAKQNINDPYSYTFSSINYFHKLTPTLDGGVLVSGFENNSSQYSANKFRVIKLDIYGNFIWDKYVFNNLNTDLNTNPLIEKYTHFPTTNDAVINILEIRNNIYVLEHYGFRYEYKRYNNSGDIDSSNIVDHLNIRYFTFIDNNGNIIKTTYNTNDTIIPVTCEYMYYDTTTNKVVIFSNRERQSQYTIPAPQLVTKRIYDTAFNLISVDTLNMDFIFNPKSIVQNFKKNTYVFQPRIYTYDTCRITKLDSSNNIIYSKRIQLNDIVDSLRELFPDYFLNTTDESNANQFLSKVDYYIDEQENIYFAFIPIVEYFTPPSGNVNIPVLCIIKMDRSGNIVQKKAIDVSEIIDGRPLYDIPYQPLLIFPSNNRLTFLALNYFQLRPWYNIQVELSTLKLLKIKRNGLQSINGYQQFNFTHDNDVAHHPIKNKSKIDNTYFSAFEFKSTNKECTGIIKFDSLGNTFPHIIQGNVFADMNNNCTKNVGDNSIPQVTVTAQNNHSTNFTSSDNFGNYELGFADTGQITVTAQPNINYPLFAQGNCTVQTSYAYLDSFTVDTINLNLKPTILCPGMYVDISTPMLRRCVSNIYTVNYKNNGTVASPNTFIDVALDRFLTVNSASIPYTNLGNNVLRFNIGNVDYLSSGRFTIDVTVRCDSTIVGQTHCVEAHIYPDTVCAASGYTGPVISTSAQCKQDSIEFKLRNSGGNMQNPKRYIVIEDNLNRLNGNYQLNNGQQKIVTIAADSGHTYGIIAEQDDAFPIQLGDKFATAFIEGCNPINGQFNTGFITQYPEFDGEPYRSVDCQQNRGAFDPNDKTGFPIGVSGQHYIEKNTAIDYKINFQNTGNDTAFKVVIVDTISKYLDINTIEPGASSHRYTFMRTDSNTIKFIFDSIKLVDSNKNEKLSHGFVKFRIQQKQNNPNGTKIYNQAEIYFDYNAPIFTNKTMHTIGDVYVRIISKTINPTYSKADVKIYPNPFRENVTIELQNMELQTTHLILLDIAGNEILQMQSINNKYLLNGSNLAKGLYLFRIQNDKTEIANGKLIVQ